MWCFRIESMEFLESKKREAGRAGGSRDTPHSIQRSHTHTQSFSVGMGEGAQPCLLPKRHKPLEPLPFAGIGGSFTSLLLLLLRGFFPELELQFYNCTPGLPGDNVKAPTQAAGFDLVHGPCRKGQAPALWPHLILIMYVYVL
jgi:hypothetical protein